MSRVRVLLKRLLARFTLVIEFCHDCGMEQPVVWTAPDRLWTHVSGHGDGSGVLCPTCFDRRAVGLGYSLRWVPQVESVTMSSFNEPTFTYTGGLAEGRGIEPRRE